MQLTLEADYAVRIVYVLSANAKRLDAKKISQEAGVTLRFSLKILRKLVSSGIVKSFKGTQGGYELNKAPCEISLLDVIETVEGQIRFNRCTSVEFICTRQKDSPCKFKQVFNDISNVIREKLSQVTFDMFV